MKTKIIQLSIVAALSVAMVFTSCRKHPDATPSESSNDQTIQADDQARVSDATNSIENDVDVAASSSTSAGGRAEGLACYLNVSISSDSLTQTINYLGTGSCTGSKYKYTGNVKITLIPASTGKKWRDLGSKLVVNYQNVVVTRLADGRSVTLNGTITRTNLTGGTRFHIDGHSQITHQIKGVITAKFSDSLASTATWYITKKRQWNASAPNSLTISGDSNSFVYTNIGESGINRRGKAFTVTSPNGVTITNCGTNDVPYFRALGEVQHHFLLGTMSVKYGSDASGNLAADACSGDGYYINWENNAGVDKYTKFVSY